jgi:Arc/MetJ family transcription regulator
MKTTIDIPEADLAEAMKSMGVRTKREAVVRSLVEYNRRQKMSRLSRHSGSCSLPSNADVEGAEDREVNA